MSELKPCPFCGGKEIIFCDDFTEYGILFFATCESCGAMAGGTNNREHQKEIALESWNTRPIEDALRAENERLRSLLRTGCNNALELGYCEEYFCLDCNNSEFSKKRR